MLVDYVNPSPPEMLSTTHGTFRYNVPHDASPKAQQQRSPASSVQARWLNSNHKFDGSQPKSMSTENRMSYIPLDPRAAVDANNEDYSAGKKSWDYKDIRQFNYNHAIFNNNGPVPFVGVPTSLAYSGKPNSSPTTIYKRPTTPHMVVVENRDFLTQNQATFVPQVLPNGQPLPKSLIATSTIFSDGYQRSANDFQAQNSAANETLGEMVQPLQQYDENGNPIPTEVLQQQVLAQQQQVAPREGATSPKSQQQHVQPLPEGVRPNSQVRKLNERSEN
jgi:hypothetical protein